MLANIKNLIMRIFGYISIDAIHIKSDYRKPRQEKLDKRKERYRETGLLPEVILDKHNLLLDGFCSYYIARVWNIKYLKFRRAKK